MTREKSHYRKEKKGKEEKLAEKKLLSKGCPRPPRGTKGDHEGVDSAENIHMDTKKKFGTFPEQDKREAIFGKRTTVAINVRKNRNLHTVFRTRKGGRRTQS